MLFLGVCRRGRFLCLEEYLVVSINAFLCSTLKEVFILVIVRTNLYFYGLELLLPLDVCVCVYTHTHEHDMYVCLCIYK